MTRNGEVLESDDAVKRLIASVNVTLAWKVY